MGLLRVRNVRGVLEQLRQRYPTSFEGIADDDLRRCLAVNSPRWVRYEFLGCRIVQLCAAVYVMCPNLYRMPVPVSSLQTEAALRAHSLLWDDSQVGPFTQRLHETVKRERLDAMASSFYGLSLESRADPSTKPELHAFGFKKPYSSIDALETVIGAVTSMKSIRAAYDIMEDGFRHMDDKQTPAPRPNLPTSETHDRGS